jgi:uncharacterized membrane protein HdeD (DUF308 family)
MSTAERPPLSRHLWLIALVSGVLTVILGVLVLMWPGISILVAAVLFGAYLLISGCTQVFSAFTEHVSAGGRVLRFISGAASLILAVLAFRHFGDAVLLLGIWIGIGFIVRGVATTVSAISDRGAPGRVWQIASGVIAVVAGIVVLGWPFTSLVTLAWVVGVWLVVTGVIEAVSSFGIRRAVKNVEGFRQTRAETGPTYQR